MDKSDSAYFFDKFPEFYKTGKTGVWHNRINHRYIAIIENNKKIIENSTILDLGSHDGRFSFAALMNGASKVLGIEGRKELVESSFENMKKYGISSEKYSFKEGDITQSIENIEPGTFDVVFCLGILYHIRDHVGFLTKIKKIKPKYLIIDTKLIAARTGVPFMRFKLEDSKNPGNSIQGQAINEKVLVGILNKASLEMILNYLRFSFKYYDWQNAKIENWEKIEDYKTGLRVSLVAQNMDI